MRHQSSRRASYRRRQHEITERRLGRRADGGNEARPSEPLLGPSWPGLRVSATQIDRVSEGRQAKILAGSLTVGSAGFVRPARHDASPIQFGSRMPRSG